MYTRPKIKKFYIESAGKKIYVQIEIPKNAKLPAPAIIVAHGLRSFYKGFLDKFAKKFRDAGYISVKVHFIGTGKSEGIFEEKNFTTISHNLTDTIDFLATRPEIKGIGVMGRSDGATLTAIMGPNKHVNAYVLLCPSLYLEDAIKVFVDTAEIKDGFFYHKSFKRAHTKGPGRLPLSYIVDQKKFEKPLRNNIPKMKNVALFQSAKDEAVIPGLIEFEYYKKHLPEPKWVKKYEGGQNHSFKGVRKEVIKDSLLWFQKTLPLK